MTTFAMRALSSFAYEKIVPRELQARGWQVHEIGMGMFAPLMRQHLQSMRDSYGRPCLWRWIPDLIATTDRFGRNARACLVDVKNVMATKPATVNYAIEFDAIKTYKVIEDCFNIPVVMLAAEADGLNARVLTVHTAFNRGSGQLFDGSNAAGSGTAFMLVKKMYAIGIDDFFGSRMIKA